VINEVAELNGCTSALFFESRKHRDLYLWAAKTPSGPTVKFHVTNVHTMAELKLSGNHLKGSRPAIHFDGSFEAAPHSRLIRELLQQVFVTPKGHRKSKPFLDHVLGFYWLDGRVWLRNFQAHWAAGGGRKASAEPPTLVEVGPRMTLNPIRVFAGAFRGAVLWANGAYVSPNSLRKQARLAAGSKYKGKIRAKAAKRAKDEKHRARQAGTYDNETVFKKE
jgi:ribosome biogenesis protein BRX1